MRKIETRLMISAAVIAILLGSFPSLAKADDTTSSTSGTTAVDNSKVNAQVGTDTTADQAKNNPSDRELMRKIRQAIVQDKSLSTYGHNVKIIAQGGAVTLKGTVHTEEEKTNIGQKAEAIAGPGHVTNNIMVKGS